MIKGEVGQVVLLKKSHLACIITGTLFERYVWIGGINNGLGAYPIVAAILLGSIVATVGYFLVRTYMQRTQLINR